MSDDDLERRLGNWAAWYYSGRSAAGSSGIISSIYKGGPRGRRVGNIMPVIDGEAIETDAAVDQLPRELREALRAHYLRVSPTGKWLGTLSDGRVAEALGCARSTLAERMERARQRLRLELNQRRQRASYMSTVAVGQ